MRPTTWLAVLTLVLLGACSRGSGAGRSATAPGPSAPRPSASGGGVAMAARDVPLEQALALARASGRPAMLYFTAGWCGYCRLLERETLSDASVGAHMSAYTNVAYDADGAQGRALATRYGVVGFPTLVRVDGQGNKVAAYEGYDPPSSFVQRIPRP